MAPILPAGLSAVGKQVNCARTETEAAVLPDRAHVQLLHSHALLENQVKVDDTGLDLSALLTLIIRA